MYTQPGRGGGSLPAVAGTTAAVVTVLPNTGPNLIIELALAAAVGLAVWALVYLARAKFAQR